jgi:tetratricopeptide (TPR) repeat protein
VTGWIDSLFSHFTAGATRLITLRPEDVAPGHDDPAVGGWRAWALADALDRAGERERAVVWINAAIHSLRSYEPEGESEGPRILKAEVFATAGRMALDHGDVGDAIAPLLDAEAQWVELCELADAAWADRSSASLVTLAGQLREMAGAVDPSHELIPLKGLEQDGWLVGTWCQERLLGRRVDVAVDAARAVAGPQVRENLIAARRICGDARDWLARTVSPGRQIRAGWLSSSEGSVALALLSMTEGNIQVEADDVEGSIETFGDAITRLRSEASRTEDLDADPDLLAWISGPSTEELSILGRLLFNQGNSYLRLERYAEARRNYEECDGIFRSIGEEESGARVQQADRLAQSRQQAQAEGRERPLDGTRQHIIEAERAVARKPDRKSRFVDKAPIVPAYRLLLGQLAERGGWRPPMTTCGWSRRCVSQSRWPACGSHRRAGAMHPRGLPTASSARWRCSTRSCATFRGRRYSWCRAAPRSSPTWHCPPVRSRWRNGCCSACSSPASRPRRCGWSRSRRLNWTRS